MGAVFDYTFGAVYSGLFVMTALQWVLPDGNLWAWTMGKMSESQISELPAIGMWSVGFSGVTNSSFCLLVLYILYQGAALQKRYVNILSMVYLSFLALTEFTHPWRFSAEAGVEKYVAGDSIAMYIGHIFMKAPVLTIVLGLLFVTTLASIWDKQFSEDNAKESTPLVLKAENKGMVNLTLVSYVLSFALFFFSVLCLFSLSMLKDAGLSAFAMHRYRGDFAADGEPSVAYHCFATAQVGVVAFLAAACILCNFGVASQKKTWAAIFFGYVLLTSTFLNATRPWTSGEGMFAAAFTAYPAPLFWTVGGFKALCAYGDSAIMGRAKSTTGWKKLL